MSPKLNCHLPPFHTFYFSRHMARSPAIPRTRMFAELSCGDGDLLDPPPPNRARGGWIAALVQEGVVDAVGHLRGMNRGQYHITWAAVRLGSPSTPPSFMDADDGRLRVFARSVEGGDLLSGDIEFALAVTRMTV